MYEWYENDDQKHNFNYDNGRLMMVSWVTIVTIVDENDTMVDLANVDPNINVEKKEKAEWWDIYVDVGGGRGGR